MKVLFLCVANSARSQLAEGLARIELPDAEIRSAGSRPGKLHPDAVAVMREIGIDLSGHYSKSVTDLPPEFLDDVDYVITLCAEEVCPLVISKAKRLHWPLPDPASNPPVPGEESRRRFREARNAISAQLTEFKGRL